MSQIATLIMNAETSGLLRGKKALEETTRAGAATEKAVTGTERGFVRAGRGAGQATPQLKGFNTAADQTRAMALAATKVLAGLATTFASMRAVGQASQTYARIGNSLRSMGVEASAVAGQIDAIGQIAQRTRSPLEATAQLYQRISIAGKDLGASQQDVLRFTENVGLALAQQGGGAEAASGALLQLSQAMAGGVVRAEEFNSVLENAYPIAQAAANAIDGAGGSVGRLRNMVIEGEISSREFFDAILSSSTALEAAFAQTTPTIAQAMSVLGTSFTLFVGSMDQAVGVSALVSEGIILLAENIDRIAAYAVTAGAVFGGAYVAGIVAARVATMTLTGTLVALRTALIRTGIGVAVVAAGELVYQFSKLVTAAGGFGNSLSLLKDVALEVWDRIGMGVEFVAQSIASMSANARAWFLGALRAMAGAFVDFTWTVANGLNALFGSNLQGASAIVTQELGLAENAARNMGDAAETAANKAKEGFSAPLESVEALRSAVSNSEKEMAGAESATDRLNKSLGDLGGGSGGGQQGRLRVKSKTSPKKSNASNSTLTRSKNTTRRSKTSTRSWPLGSCPKAPIKKLFRI